MCSHCLITMHHNLIHHIILAMVTVKKIHMDPGLSASIVVKDLLLNQDFLISVRPVKLLSGTKIIRTTLELMAYARTKAIAGIT